MNVTKIWIVEIRLFKKLLVEKPNLRLILLLFQEIITSVQEVISLKNLKIQ